MLVSIRPRKPFVGSPLRSASVVTKPPVPVLFAKQIAPVARPANRSAVLLAPRRVRVAPRKVLQPAAPVRALPFTGRGTVLRAPYRPAVVPKKLPPVIIRPRGRINVPALRGYATFLRPVTPGGVLPPPVPVGNVITFDAQVCTTINFDTQIWTVLDFTGAVDMICDPRVADAGTQVILRVIDESLLPVPLAGWTVTIKMKQGLNVTKSFAGIPLTDGTDGKVYCLTLPDTWDRVGVWSAQALAVNGAKSFNSKPAVFRVGGNI